MTSNVLNSHQGWVVGLQRRNIAAVLGSNERLLVAMELRREGKLRGDNAERDEMSRKRSLYAAYPPNI